ncbi:B-type lectin plumieribetin-like [Anoplopoma fimbria]|uniref:B-type lectin plumieribetin-like n=1 Tax=Anoplopoma fimbria TaxID=229290 RepID=UPI0023ECE6BB|nr:B-type lectin plumieribetin-like [Anoplopoma fimbria]
MSRNYLSRNDELRRGDYLMSNNREWKAIFQDDGNFVVYGWKSVWATGTNGSDVFRLCMQADNNLVMYNKDGSAKWSTGTYMSDVNMCRLQLTDDGKLVVTREAEQIWSS